MTVTRSSGSGMRDLPCAGDGKFRPGFSRPRISRPRSSRPGSSRPGFQHHFLRVPNWPGRTTLLQDPSAHIYSVLFLLVYISLVYISPVYISPVYISLVFISPLFLYLPCLYISPEPWASHSFILSVPIHAPQATPPHQARSFS